MNYQLTCVCGHKFIITSDQLQGHVLCPSCKRPLSPVVSQNPFTQPPAPAPANPHTETSMTTSPTDPEPTKRCPFCGEVILAIAKKCKHCGEFLDRAPNPVAPNQPATPAPSASLAEDPPVFDLTVSQWDNFWRFTICLFITLGACAALVTFAPPHIAAIAVPATLVIMGFIGWFFYLSTKNSRCIIRPMRIETETGILSKDLTAVELFRVTDLELKQGLMERILGIGTIRVISTDSSTPELILYEIPQAKKVYKYLQQQVPVAARQRGAVYLEK